MKKEKPLICFFLPRHKCLKEQCAVWDEENNCCSFKRVKRLNFDPTNYIQKVMKNLEQAFGQDPHVKLGIKAGLQPFLEEIQEKPPKTKEKDKTKYWEKELKKMDKEKTK